MKQHSPHLVVSLLCLSALVLLFVGVDPESKPLAIVFLPVLLLWIGLYFFGRWLISFVQTPHAGLLRIIMTVMVSMVVLLVMLSGIGQLRAVDFVLVSALAAVSTFYLYRTWG